MNKYGSRTNTFMGPDLYNLASVMAAPADMTLAASVFAQAFLQYQNTFIDVSAFPGFEINDRPYIHGLGMFSNFADGLVPIPASSKSGVTGSVQLTVQLIRFGAVLGGLITNVAGNANISGVGTSFTQQLSVGQQLFWYDDNRALRSGTVLTVTDDTNIVLTAVTASTGMYQGATTGVAAMPRIFTAGSAIIVAMPVLNVMNQYGIFLGDVTNVRTPRGRITVTAGSATVTGVGTLFQTDLAVGQSFQYTDDTAVARTATITAIASQVSMTIAAVAPAATTGTLAPFNAYDSQLSILVSVPQTVTFATISINPLYNARRLIFSAQAVIEHSRE